MASIELSWTDTGKDHADLILSYDPATADANGNVVVTGASGTYQTLDANNNVVDTDQVTGLIAPNSFILAPDDELNVLGRNPIVDTSGVGVIINNPADADEIGPDNTPEVIFSTDVFGDYEEAQKGPATGVTLSNGGGGTPPGGQPSQGAGDSVSIDPDAAFIGHGTFVLTGQASAPSGVASVTFTADVDGVETSLGSASVNSDGSFSFTDHVDAHVQGFITATETDGAGTGAGTTAPFALTAGLRGGTAVARQDNYSADGSVFEWSALEHDDGSRGVLVEAPDQTVVSQFRDTFRSQGMADTTFVFTPGYGHDVVGKFQVGGADHDTLSLPSADFQNLAAVLSATQQGTAGAVIRDAATGDSILLAGVSKAELAANPADVKFHP